MLIRRGIDGSASSGTALVQPAWALSVLHYEHQVGLEKED
jgi:hypothetical protein